MLTIPFTVFPASTCGLRVVLRSSASSISRLNLFPPQRYSVFNVVYPPHTHNVPWRRKLKGMKSWHLRTCCKLIQSGAFVSLHRLSRWPLNRHSFQDALRAFFQPIKNDDARLDFYTMYKREATDYDADYVKKYDEDLNTTLIFVRRTSSASASYLTCSRRRVCSPPSVLPSSSTSTRSYNPTRTTKRQPSSVQSSSPSTSPLSQTKPPPFHPSWKILPARSSSSLDSCTRVS